MVDEPGYPAQGWVDQVKSIYDHLPPAVQGVVDTLGAVTAPLHSPSPPLQSNPDQAVVQTGPADAAGRVFPLVVRPDNAPTATYHSQGGSDLMAPRGTPVAAMQSGKVEEVFQDKGDHQFGGNAVLIHGSDGLDYYYAHFDAPTYLKQGDTVQAGQEIGAVGNSGNAYKDGTGATHLHIGIGHGISDGVGSEGGLGKDFNAQNLLMNLENGVPAQGTAVQRTQQPTVLGGTTAPTAKPPLVVDRYQAPTAIQSAQDVLGGAASALGSAAQGVIGQVQQGQPSQIGETPRRGQAPLTTGQPTPEAQQLAASGQQPTGGLVQQAAPVLGQAASDVGTAAQNVVLGAQDVGQRAVDAAAPVLGGVSQVIQQGGQMPPDWQEATDRSHQLEALIKAQNPLRDVPVLGGVTSEAATVLGEIPGVTPAMIQDYRDFEQQKAQAIQAINPLYNLPGARPPQGQITPASVVAGLVQGAAEMGTSPAQLILPFGAVASLGEQALLRVGVSAGVAKLSEVAVSNGLMGAVQALIQPDASPESIGQAFLDQAVLGSGIHVGAGLLRPFAARIGQAFLDNAPKLGDLLRSRQPGEANVNFAAAGVPGAIDRLRGAGEAEATTPTAPGEVTPAEAAASPPLPPSTAVGRQRLPNYDPNTPEGRFEAIARPLREASPDGLLHLDLNTLPKDVLPLDANAAPGSGIVKANPGGMPNTDHLRALYEANQAKRDFYYDQSDQGVPTVGPDNLEEWFALNSIMSQRTGVTTQVREAIDMMGTVRKIAQDGRDAGLSPTEIRANILKAVNDFNYAGPSGPNKRIGATRGYATGVGHGRHQDADVRGQLWLG